MNKHSIFLAYLLTLSLLIGVFALFIHVLFNRLDAREAYYKQPTYSKNNQQYKQYTPKAKPSDSGCVSYDGNYDNDHC